MIKIDIRVGKKSELQVKKIGKEHALETEKRVVFGPGRCWESHVMRIFTIKQGGKTFQHQHDWPHWVFVLSGEGSVIVNGDSYSVIKDNYIFIPKEVEHCLVNDSNEPFEFICIVPQKGDIFQKE